ncbi:MAG: hypothetical protein E2O56_03730 [Gammaproteobacteria bacterium]|nr:MAG: hypothetical protein E2O56_03730 [Gammaproteobacteria bacterium]
MTRFLFIFVMLGGILLLTACASTPVPLRGKFPPVTPLDAQQNPPRGTTVRWGGGIIAVEPGANDTCVEILARPLESWARPQATTANFGRFLACTRGFLDPEIFRRNRDITIVGQVTGIEHRPVGDFDYPYPRVRATEMYLWAPRVRVWSPYWGPGWGRWGWGPGWGGWGPGWGHRGPYRGWGAWGWYYPYPYRRW